MTSRGEAGGRLEAAGVTPALVRSRSNLEPALRLMTVVLLLAATLAVALTLFHPLVLAATGVAGGFLLVCLFSAFHDTVHLSLFRGRRANVVLGRALGPIVLLPYTAYRGYHLDHHRLAGADGDPEGRQAIPDRAGLAAALLIPGFFIAFHADALAAFARRPAATLPRRALAVEYAVLALWLAVVAGLCVMAPKLGAAIVCAYVAYPVWFAFTALPEHHGCDLDADPIAATRSLRSNPVFRYLYFNGNLHAEHHLHPRLPSRYLWRVHLATRPELKHYAPGYLAYYRDLLAGLRRAP